ncbi:MAG: alpha/beta hydrolase family protein [Mucilaginibacter sp.]|uniref:alpha/beta hydrolase n=1 Tax=Mucilaginibacter sp. TaxID=1882438 RepID=UPI003263FA3E
MKKTIKVILILCALFAGKVALAAQVDTVETYSLAMHKNIRAIIIKPDNYKQLTTLPTVYLLHGHGSNNSAWLRNAPVIKELADQYQLLLVCPDGNISSWYVDSPIDSNWRYETYVGLELVKWVDEHYKTIKNSGGRAITGFSMGGHGSLYLAFKHQDIFGAAGSTSGGVDIRPFSNSWKIADVLGTYKDHPNNWENNTVINMTGLLIPGKLALIIDCGTEDFFYKVNLNFHNILLENKIPHDFITRPGAHNWAYWSNSIIYQLAFFNEYFRSKNKS